MLHSAAHQIAAAGKPESGLSMHTERFPGGIRKRLTHVVVYTNHGCNHLIGEQPVMYTGSESFNHADAWDGALLTSHNLAIFAWNKPRLGPIPLRGLTNAKIGKDSGLMEPGELHATVNGETVVRHCFVGDKVLPMLTLLAKVPATDQTPADVPLLTGGLAGLDSALTFQDGRLALMRAGLATKPDIALAEAVVLWHHTEHMGRGMKDGWWLSSMAPGRFRQAIEEFFGAPTSDEPGPTQKLHWATGSASEGDLARTAGKAAAKVLSGGLAGGGKHVVMMKHYGASYRAEGTFTAFQLTGAKTTEPTMLPLNQVHAERMAELFDWLRAEEARTLGEALAGGIDEDTIEALVPGRGTEIARHFRDPGEDRWDPKERLPDGFKASGGPTLPEAALDVPEEESDPQAQVDLLAWMMIGSGVLNVLISGGLVLSLIWVCVGVMWIPGLLIGVAEIVMGWKLKNGEVHEKIKTVNTAGIVAALLSLNVFAGAAAVFARIYLNDDEVEAHMKTMAGGGAGQKTISG
ncbi:MAG: hypothetical protein GY913_03350 [Proteobacteria bacterium]|nr:hypothetical protein [Pseudomonadota bacterium]MCP4915936.1 hypothetical protein [Pseudomonadota bacterium]